MKRLVTLLLIPFAVFCQSKETKYIVVRGSAEVKVPVDYLQVSISVHSYSATSKTANDSNHATVLKMLNVLSKYAVADSDFQTNDNSSREDLFSKDPDHRSIINYTAQFNLRRVKSFDSLFQELMAIGNIDINVRGNGSIDGAKYKILAYQKAFKVAQHEAEVLAASAGQKLGQLIKLIQDNRDVFTQYDDINQIVEGLPKSLPPERMYRGEAVTVSAQAVGVNFRRDFYTQFAELTAIFELR